MNCNYIEGSRQMKSAEIGIITKSYKDVMSLICITHGRYSIGAIAPPSESHLLPKDMVEKCWTNYKYVASLMDFDFTGKNMAWKLKATYNISPLFLTNGSHNTKNYGAKDFSAFVKANTKEKVLGLVDNAYNYIKSSFKYESSRIKF